MDQTSLAFKAPDAATDKHILALSWNIATEPKLYRELASNPYSPAALQILSERFPDVSIADSTRAIVLAEPEGKYDRNFKQLPKAQQEEELSRQRDISSDIHKRLDQYYKKYAKEFSQLSKEFVYDSLSILAFETTDTREIELRYAQNQRRDFRVSIVNFIEDAPKNDDRSSAIEPINKKSVLPRQLLKASFAALSLILFFFLTQRQVHNPTQHLDIKRQVLAIEDKKERQAMPRRLMIPTINIDTSIQDVGVTLKGAMGVPNNTVDVGWFDFGPRPGERGSAVIAGHFDDESGKAAVFAHLDKLKEGDKVYIDDDKGATTSFVVRQSRTYDPGYADDVFSSSDTAHLNLITCAGTWDNSKNIYSKRLVIFADIVN